MQNTHKKSGIQQILADNSLEICPENFSSELDKISEKQVEVELDKPFAPFSLKRLMTLISPAAEQTLEKQAQTAQQITRQRFGKTMLLYAPLYVSNYCVNKCAYCGFNTSHKIERKRLTIEEAVIEAKAIAGLGFRDLLLVSGEDPNYVTIDYLKELVKILRKDFATISIEIYPMEEADYRTLFESGVDGVTLYQESYDKNIYNKFHLGGPKKSYEDRLVFQENAAKAGMRRLGIGSLLGLSDWRYECVCMALHAKYLIQHYWQSKVSFSFPRIRTAAGVELDGFSPVSDRNMVQMVTALRICFPDCGLTLSTREPADFRDNIIHLGFTQVSAESKTTPGGYAGDTDATGQFDVSDKRSASTVAQLLDGWGLEPVWKDWDSSFIKHHNMKGRF